MEPSQPVDPVTGPMPSIPQARRSTEEPSREPAAADPADGADPGVATDPAGAGQPGSRRAGSSPRDGGPGVPPEDGGPGAAVEDGGPGTASGDATATEPATGDGDATEERPAPSVWNVRSIALVILAVVLALATAGYFIGYRLYDKAVQPNRSTPGVAVRQYLTATFDDRNQTAVRRFTCDDPATMNEIQDLLATVESRERQFGIHIDVSWDDVRARTQSHDSTVTAAIKIHVPEANGQWSESIQHWEFALRDRSGWRVCDAHRTG